MSGLEVIGSVASVLQLAATVYSISRTLYEVGDALSNAPSDIKDLARDLETFSEELHLLSCLLDEKTHRYSDRVYRLTAKIIGDCASICVKIHRILRKLRSGSFLARVKWVFKEKEIIKLLARLRDLKLSLMGTLSLLSALKADHMMDAMGVANPSLLDGPRDERLSRETAEEVEQTRRKLAGISAGRDSEMMISEDISGTTLTASTTHTSSEGQKSFVTVAKEADSLDASWSISTTGFPQPFGVQGRAMDVQSNLGEKNAAIFMSAIALPKATTLAQLPQAMESVQSFHSALSRHASDSSEVAHRPAENLEVSNQTGIVINEGPGPLGNMNASSSAVAGHQRLSLQGPPGNSIEDSTVSSGKPDTVLAEFRAEIVDMAVKRFDMTREVAETWALTFKTPQFTNRVAGSVSADQSSVTRPLSTMGTPDDLNLAKSNGNVVEPSKGKSDFNQTTLTKLSYSSTCHGSPAYITFGDSDSDDFEGWRAFPLRRVSVASVSSVDSLEEDYSRNDIKKHKIPGNWMSDDDLVDYSDDSDITIRKRERRGEKQSPRSNHKRHLAEGALAGAGAAALLADHRAKAGEKSHERFVGRAALGAIGAEIKTRARSRYREDRRRSSLAESNEENRAFRKERLELLNKIDDLVDDLEDKRKANEKFRRESSPCTSGATPASKTERRPTPPRAEPRPMPSRRESADRRPSRRDDERSERSQGSYGRTTYMPTAPQAPPPHNPFMPLPTNPARTPSVSYAPTAVTYAPAPVSYTIAPIYSSPLLSATSTRFPNDGMYLPFPLDKSGSNRNNGGGKGARRRVRRPTPDSDALASSEDERFLDEPAIRPHKPTRRASWSNDIMNDGTAGSKSLPWSGGSWNIDSGRERRSRLSEVVPPRSANLHKQSKTSLGLAAAALAAASAFEYRRNRMDVTENAPRGRSRTRSVSRRRTNRSRSLNAGFEQVTPEESTTKPTFSFRRRTRSISEAEVSVPVPIGRPLWLQAENESLAPSPGNIDRRMDDSSKDRRQVRKRSDGNDWESDGDVSTTSAKIEKQNQGSDEDPQELVDYRRETEYHDRSKSAPNAIIIHQRAPEPQQIIVQEAPPRPPTLLPVRPRRRDCGNWYDYGSDIEKEQRGSVERLEKQRTSQTASGIEVDQPKHSEIIDPEERRRVQNRIARRKFRDKAKAVKEPQVRDAKNRMHAGYAYSTPEPKDMGTDHKLSGLPWGSFSLKHVVSKDLEEEYSGRGSKKDIVLGLVEDFASTGNERAAASNLYEPFKAAGDELERHIRKIEEADAAEEKRLEKLSKKRADERKASAAEEERKLREAERKMERLEDEKERTRAAAAPKKEQQKMSLEAFLTDEKMGSWADEMEDMKQPDIDTERETKGDNKTASTALSTLSLKLQSLTLGTEKGSSTTASDNSMSQPPNIPVTEKRSKPAALSLAPLNTKPHSTSVISPKSQSSHRSRAVLRLMAPAFEDAAIRDTSLDSKAQHGDLWWRAFIQLRVFDHSKSENLTKAWSTAQAHADDSLSSHATMDLVARMTVTRLEFVINKAQLHLPNPTGDISRLMKEMISRFHGILKVMQTTLNFRVGAFAWTCLCTLVTQLLVGQSHKAMLRSYKTLENLSEIATLVARYNVLESMYQQWPNMSLETKYESSLIELCVHVLRCLDSMLFADSDSASQEISVAKIREADVACRGFSVTITSTDGAEAGERQVVDVSTDDDDSDCTELG